MKEIDRASSQMETTFSGPPGVAPRGVALGLARTLPHTVGFASSPQRVVHSRALSARCRRHKDPKWIQRIQSAALAHAQAKSRRKLLLHESFRAAITLKGIDGLLEATGGVILWFVSPSALNHIALHFLEQDLPFDRHEFITIHLYRATEHLAMAPGTSPRSTLAHGLIKAFWLLALWFDALWAYPATMIVFGLFCAYQVHRFLTPIRSRSSSSPFSTF